MSWTSEQQAAIEKSGSLIVAAGAGAGKTAVLTERIARLVSEGVHVEELLVLTFTRAAAAEMKARIEGRLSAMAREEGDEDRRRRLFAEARGVNSAQISTIHAFCAGVLRRHGHLIGLSRDTRIGDEMELAVLTGQVKDKLLTRLGEEENGDWRLLLSAFGSEDGAWNAVSALNIFLLSQPDPAAFLDAALLPYQRQADMEQALLEVVSFSKGEVRQVIAAMEEERDALSPEMAGVIGVLDEELMRYRALLMQPDYQTYRQGLFAFSYGTMRFPKGTPEEEKTPIQKTRDQCKKIIKEQQALFSRPMEEECAAMEEAGEILLALRKTAEAFTTDFTATKRDKGMMDFADLEHLTLQVLNNQGAREDYQHKFSFVAVDEYQDTSLVQEGIIERVLRGDNGFFVGDVKQSIYRFRQAEPKLFLKKLMAFTAGQAGSRIDLNQNFRSAGAVLTAVNQVFSAIMSQGAGELAYDQRAMLQQGRPQPEGRVELHLIQRTGDAPQEDALETAADAEVEAMLIAASIRELMEGPGLVNPETGKAAPYCYSDFAILLRSTTYAQLIAQTLSQCGIPCYAQTNGGYFDAVEVQVLLNLLRVVDNRLQDVALLSVMRSSIGDFSTGELTDIRLMHRPGPYYEAVFSASEGAGPLAEKIRTFLDMLERYREESRLVSLETLLGMLLDETGFYEQMGAGETGRQRQANLNALLDKARIFEQSGQRGIWSFLTHMELARDNASFGTADTAASNVVRILTIHKSKGLEFPVVFLCQTGARFNLRDGGEPLLLHGELGFGLKYIRQEKRVKKDTAYRGMIARRLRLEQQAEEMRVLYVAMTRAKYRLMITGCVSGAGEKADQYQPVPSPLSVLRCTSMSQWLLMGKRDSLLVRVHERREFLPPGERETGGKLGPWDPETLSALEARFSWRYPFPAAVTLPAKAAVSRISAGEEALPSLDVPAFVDSGAKQAAFFGTAMHALLERVPLCPPLMPSDAEGFIKELGKTGALTKIQLERASVRCLSWFLSTELYARMTKSHRVERELAFGYEADASSVFNTDAEERVLLQGVIDCALLEAEGWVLLDYKTDRLKEGDTPAATAENHRMQLNYYATALSALTDTPVKEAYVVLLTQREIVRVL